nr:MAG TPA: hypothetical protein [Caudoviricetes sp.]
MGQPGRGSRAEAEERGLCLCGRKNQYQKLGR